MNQCPKCNCTNIAGPKYFRKAWGAERLLYTCNRCGYSTETPTKDSLAADTVQPLKRSSS